MSTTIRKLKDVFRVNLSWGGEEILVKAPTMLSAAKKYANFLRVKIDENAPMTYTADHEGEIYSFVGEKNEHDMTRIMLHNEISYTSSDRIIVYPVEAVM